MSHGDRDRADVDIAGKRIDIIFKRGNSVEHDRLVMGENTAGLAFGFSRLSTKHTTIEAIMPSAEGLPRKYLPAAVAATWQHYRDRRIRRRDIP